VKILKYANSGDTAGDKSRVVGYISAAVYIEDHVKKDSGSVYAKEAVEKGDPMLTKEQKIRLLKMARQTIEIYLADRKIPKIEEKDPTLNRPMGAFVTLHEKGELRGCIGNIIGQKPLWQTVQDMAVESAVGDPRFSAVSKGELESIDIEISVLSELEKISSPDEIEMGKHGVLIRKGYRSGVFLPQVADETGWSKEEFMSNLCAHKAGLPEDAWKGKDVDIYIFTADVFGEKEMQEGR